jgi:hypothetical protein
MPDYEKVEVSEQHLEDLVRIYAGKVEDGLRYVDHQHSTTAGGRLDVLFVDSGDSVVVAELKVVEDDGMLLQGLDYYDYVASHLESFTRLYKLPVASATQSVRLFLIAPSFSQTLVSRCRWIDVPISPFTYSCLRLEATTEVIPVFSEVTVPSPPEAIEVYQISDRLNYITDDAVRQSFEVLLEQVREWGPSVSIDAVKYDVSLKVDGRVFAYLSPRRKHYVVSTNNAEDVWTSYPIRGDDDLQPAVDLMKRSLEKQSH